MEPRQAAPGQPAHLPLHRVTVRFPVEDQEKPVWLVGRQHEERTELAYFQGLHRGRRIYRLADADGSPRDRLWAVREEEIVADVPAELQPERVPAAVRRERERFTETEEAPCSTS